MNSINSLLDNGFDESSWFELLKLDAFEEPNPATAGSMRKSSARWMCVNVISTIILMMMIIIIMIKMMTRINSPELFLLAPTEILEEKKAQRFLLALTLRAYPGTVKIVRKPFSMSMLTKW